MVNSIVIGQGEVGKALKAVLSKEYDVYGIDIDTVRFPASCQFLNICIPYSKEFVKIVNDYVERFKPSLTIIHSSVPIGTTKKIKGFTVHSPVRGRHPNIAQDLRRYIKFVGYNDKKSLLMAIDYLGKCFSLKVIPSSDETEFLKIASLTKYLVYLWIADEINNACRNGDFNYENVKLWDRSQNDKIGHSYKDMKWPILNPPLGKIGGHCVLPISEYGVKDERFDSKIIGKILKKYKNI